MKCHDSREYLYAFLDNELDAPLSIELQRHLDGCATCAREAEIERTVCKRLGTALAADDAMTQDFDESCEAWLGRDEPVAPSIASTDRTPVRGWGRILATAAVLTFVVSAGVWLTTKPSPSVSGGTGFADLVVADFEHFLEEGGELQVESDRPDVVADWLRGKTAVAIALPQIPASVGKLTGGRKCKIAGQPAAFAVYEINGMLASLVAVPIEHMDLSDLRAAAGDGATYRTASRDGYTVVAALRGPLVYAAVSTLSDKQLTCLISGNEHESD